MGDATEDYLGFNFAQNDTSLADGNSHSFGSNMEEAKRNWIWCPVTTPRIAMRILTH